jgi:uncharacterized protein YegL
LSIIHTNLFENYKLLLIIPVVERSSLRDKFKIMKKKNKLMSKVLSFVSMFTLFLSVGGVAQAATEPALNPTLGESCGIKVVLVLDSSDSMSDADIVTVKNAANTLAGSLMPANPVGVIDFDTHVLNYLDPVTDVTTVTNAINSIGHTSATESTNWDAALNEASTMVGKGDLVIVITDGNPTTHDGSGDDLDNAIIRANTIKDNGARILAIGIDSSGTQGGLNQPNLEKISGTQVISGTFTDINTVDVYLGDISTLGSVLANLTTALCGGHISVSKQLYMGDAPTISGGEGWTFLVNGKEYTTDENGSVSVLINEDSTDNTVSEIKIPSNFPFRSVSCTSGTQTGGQPEVTGIAVTSKTTVECTFVNTQPDMCPGDLDPGVQASSDNCTVPPELCTDQTATNVGYPLPCNYPETMCKDETANNYNEALPCKYSQDVDACPNLDGIQTTVPSGYYLNSHGNCAKKSSGGGSGSKPKVTTPGQVLGAEATCGIYVDKFLKKGLKGNDPTAVSKVQTFLNNYMTSGLAVDGKFGPLTDAALKAFQLKHADKILVPWGLTKPTGIFYLTTQTEVNNIMCPALGLPIPALTPMASNPMFPKA